jgi:hypothetical protein
MKYNEDIGLLRLPVRRFAGLPVCRLSQFAS